MEVGSQLSKALRPGLNRMGVRSWERKGRSFLGESRNIKVFQPEDRKVKLRNNIATILIISKMEMKLSLKEGIVHRVLLEKPVTSKVVDLLLRPVRDQLDIQK